MKQSVDRIVDVIELLSAHPRGLAVTDTALRLGIPASGVHRIMAMLAQRGMVEQDPADRTYRLTLKFACVGLKLLAGASFHTVIQPLLERYARESGDLVRLAVIVEDTRLVWIANAQGARAQLRVDPLAGHDAMAHLTAAGKAWLATLDASHLARVLAAASASSPIPAHGTRLQYGAQSLHQDLALCRQRGYAVIVDEIEPGLTAVAAVVVTSLDGRERPVASISVAGPTVRIPAARIAELGAMMIAAAREIAEVWALLGTQVQLPWNEVSGHRSVPPGWPA